MKNVLNTDQKTLGRDDIRYGLLACLSFLVLIISLLLTPDPSGTGTHKKLGLPACGFKQATGIPGPTCGYTTAFAHQANGQMFRGWHVQPAGSLVFWVVCATGVLSVFELLGWSRVLDHVGRHLSRRHLILVGVMLLLGWIFKLWVFAGYIPGGP